MAKLVGGNYISLRSKQILSLAFWIVILHKKTVFQGLFWTAKVLQNFSFFTCFQPIMCFKLKFSFKDLFLGKLSTLKKKMQKAKMEKIFASG